MPHFYVQCFSFLEHVFADLLLSVLCEVNLQSWLHKVRTSDSLVEFTIFKFSRTSVFWPPAFFNLKMVVKNRWLLVTDLSTVIWLNLVHDYAWISVQIFLCGKKELYILYIFMFRLWRYLLSSDFYYKYVWNTVKLQVTYLLRLDRSVTELTDSICFWCRSYNEDKLYPLDNSYCKSVGDWCPKQSAHD